MARKPVYLTGSNMWIVIFTLFSIILSFAFFIYWIGVIFTNSRIRPSNVPCYASGEDVYRGLGTFYMDQYLVEWILAFLSYSAFIYPQFQILLWVGTATSSKSYRLSNLFISTFVFVYFAIYELYALYQLSFCTDWNICRSCGCAQKFDCTPNPWFTFRVIFVVWFLIETLAYGFFAFTKLIEKDRIEVIKKRIAIGQLTKYLKEKRKLRPIKDRKESFFL